MTEPEASRGMLPDARMSPAERRSALWIAAVYGVRMLGMFLILPVFAVHAASMPGGGDPRAIGLALGIYGLTQALLQIPFGSASDRFGRKPVILAGLAVMFAGSLVAAWAPTLGWLTAGRALQGAGAVSAALSALVSDLTRDAQRTKAMAMIGGTIGVAFALSLIVAPLLYRFIGMSGIFVLTGLTALAAMAVIAWLVPAPGGRHGETPLQPQMPLQARTPAQAPLQAQPQAGITASGAGRGVAIGGSWRNALDPSLLRLDFGVFALHAAQMAMFTVVPARLVHDGGLPLAQHWQVYLPVVGLSFVAMMPLLIRAERGSGGRSVFQGAILLLALVQLALAALPAGLWVTVALLFGFFFAFNLLEAQLPSLTSRLAPAAGRGLALGVFNTAQSLGVFCGGLLGGLLSARAGGGTVFVAVAVLLAVWWWLARGMTRWPVRAAAAAAPASASASGRPA